jgi:hypothetical protein
VDVAFPRCRDTSLAGYWGDTCFLGDHIDAAVAGLLGAAIGALAGVIGSVLTAWQQNRTERERRRAAQRDESLKTQRQTLLHVAARPVV